MNSWVFLAGLICFICIWHLCLYHAKCYHTVGNCFVIHLIIKLIFGYFLRRMQYLLWSSRFYLVSTGSMVWEDLVQEGQLEIIFFCWRGQWECLSFLWTYLLIKSTKCWKYNFVLLGHHFLITKEIAINTKLRFISCHALCASKNALKFSLAFASRGVMQEVGESGYDVE